jgi:hypothetical protein
MQFSAIFSLKDGEDLALLEEEEQQKELELGRGNRARKEVAYQEQLSERDWLKVSHTECLVKCVRCQELDSGRANMEGGGK